MCRSARCHAWLIGCAGLLLTSDAAAREQTSGDREFDGGGYCWVELGGGAAAFASGAFYAKPNPQVTLRRPGRLWHLGKVLFERSWMGGGLERGVARLGLALGGKLLKVPTAL